MNNEKSEAIKKLYDVYKINSEDNEYIEKLKNFKDDRIYIQTYAGRQIARFNSDNDKDKEYEVNLTCFESSPTSNKFKTSPIKIKCHFGKTIVAKMESMVKMTENYFKDKLNLKLNNDEYIYPKVILMFEELNNMEIDIDSVFKNLNENIENVYQNINILVELIKKVKNVKYFIEPISISLSPTQSLDGTIKYKLIIVIPKKSDSSDNIISPLTHILKNNYIPNIREIIKKKIDILMVGFNKKIVMETLKPIDDKNLIEDYCKLFKIDLTEFLEYVKNKK